MDVGSTSMPIFTCFHDGEQQEDEKHDKVTFLTTFDHYYSHSSISLANTKR